jgi:colanic acid biosynthesis glycosyl transferase WcaI
MRRQSAFRIHQSAIVKVLLLNQCFYPDVMATGQYLTDLALELVKQGHEVKVISSKRGYDDPSIRFPNYQKWQGIEIFRVRSIAPDKRKRWRRALNFGSFWVNCAFRLAVLPRVDIVIALTSPPLISFLGALYARLRRAKLFFWVMDLNPDEAIVAGWLKESSLAARLLEFFLRYSLRRAEKVIALDRFMRQRLLTRDIPADKVVVVPPWVLSEEVSYDEEGRRRFRTAQNLSEKFVVMYAGNHSPCHPLATVLEAARLLSDHDDIVFCFVGGGSEQEKVRKFSDDYRLQNIRCLPYQPLNELSGSLSAADLHLVVMGEVFPGIIHPCKIYNILAVGSPVLYVGPEESHITDIARDQPVTGLIRMARHGDAPTVAREILEAASQQRQRHANQPDSLSTKFSRQAVLPALVGMLDAAAGTSLGAGPIATPLSQRNISVDSRP